MSLIVFYPPKSFSENIKCFFPYTLGESLDGNPVYQSKVKQAQPLAQVEKPSSGSLSYGIDFICTQIHSLHDLKIKPKDDLLRCRTTRNNKNNDIMSFVIDNNINRIEKPLPISIRKQLLLKS